MKAAIFKAKGTIEVGERPDPTIENPTDAIVRVVRGCVCGSDLWYYRGINQHKVGSPTWSGVTFARREVRNSPRSSVASTRSRLPRPEPGKGVLSGPLSQGLPLLL